MKIKLKENLKRNNKNYRNKGVTLIALVITIIVLLILAGVTIATLTGENGIITQAQKAKEATQKAQSAEKGILEDIENYLNRVTVSEEGYNAEEGVNEPKLKEGMIPVYYDETNKVWKKAEQSNKGQNKWYDYSYNEETKQSAKQWANIVTVADSDSYLREVEVGTEIPMDKITSFFVWIPRYAYSITSGYKKGTNANGAIDITFLKGNTNVGTDGVSYATDYDETKLEAGATTPKIVHPGFTFGNSQVNGIWVAKFEASGTNQSGDAVGNASSSSSTAVAVDSSTFVKILPSVISWRHITIGESEYQCINMNSNTDKYGWTSGVNSHLIKNNEWGAVAYLCYSQYGQVAKTNGSGSLISNSWRWYNMYTGAGPNTTTNESWYGIQDEGTDNVKTVNGGEFTEATHGYNTANGKLASTTGNVYGVYDMAGGAWERVAAYLDNGNGTLSSTGKSTTDSSIQYFKNGVLDGKYTSYWNSYKVSEEEKSNKILVERVGPISQGTLWQNNNFGENYQVARKRITDATYNFLEKVKGIGVNEMANQHSFYGPYSEKITAEDGKQTDVYKGWTWWLTSTIQGTARTWNNDYVLIGHASYPFVVRGGSCNDGSFAGVLCTNLTNGNPNGIYGGFRPALAF